MISMSSPRSRTQRTARPVLRKHTRFLPLRSPGLQRRFQATTYFQAATEVMQARVEVLVTFPPKAPPILLTWQETLLDGMSSVSATSVCVRKPNVRAAGGTL